MKISSESRQDLHSIVQHNPDTAIKTGASLSSWGAYCDGREITRGCWSPQEKDHHISWLELLCSEGILKTETGPFSGNSVRQQNSGSIPKQDGRYQISSINSVVKGNLDMVPARNQISVCPRGNRISMQTAYHDPEYRTALWKPLNFQHSYHSYTVSQVQQQLMPSLNIGGGNLFMHTPFPLVLEMIVDLPLLLPADRNTLIPLQFPTLSQQLSLVGRTADSSKQKEF